MARLTKGAHFTASSPRPETPMERTTRAVTEIIDGQTEKRESKTARLRKARLEREASTLEKVVEPKSKKTRAKPSVKTSK